MYLRVLVKTCWNSRLWLWRFLFFPFILAFCCINVFVVWFQDVFKLIIGLFADLADTANPLFAKRVKVLDTMAQLKCCILMLEIDCTDLVLEMFNVFFSVVRLRSISTFSLPLLVLSCLTRFLSLLYNWDIDHFAFVWFVEGLYVWHWVLTVFDLWV
jgi:hypothetical protein